MTTRYGALLLDPPWAFLTRGGKSTTPHRGEDEHYKVMTLAEIAALPVPALAAPNCALFLWVVDSHLDVAFTLFNVWGFSYKTIAFVWNKRGRLGMGYWTRKQAEICLLATRGRPTRLGKGVRQVIEAPRREHSRKPDEVYTRIETLTGGPYLEMFARQQWPGWDAWGDEVTKFPAAPSSREGVSQTIFENPFFATSDLEVG